MGAPHLLTGRLGERIACRHLMRAGFDILARRFRARHGEIDIVAFDAGTLVFVEIKTRASGRYGGPWEFVDREKQRNLQSAADEFISRFDMGAYACRFDIVAVTAPGTRPEEILHLRNAF